MRRARALVVCGAVLLGCGGDDDGGAGADGGGGGGDGGAGADAGGCTVAPVTGVSKSGGGDGAALVRGEYDYAPTVMVEDGLYRMWWCGGVAGDHILYAEAENPDGPWHGHGSAEPNSTDDVFQPTGNTADFDGTHTCDPSVIRVDGTYYMYYGGYPLPGDGETTRMGLATSADGLTWTRGNGGAPLFVPARDFTTVPNKYGLGQPSALFKDGQVYLSFTDTTASGANPVNGAGQFVVRSADPTFQSGVEELRADGFVPYDAATTRPYSLTEAFSPDWVYAETLAQFVFAVDGTTGKIELRFFDGELAATTSELVDFAWAEGPGIAHGPDGHLPASDSCGELPVHIMRAVGDSIPNWDLGHAGATIAAPAACDCDAGAG